MEQLQPKITELNELMSEMKDADGVDPEELSQLQSELKDFDSNIESLNEDMGKEEQRYVIYKLQRPIPACNKFCRVIISRCYMYAKN